jgi:hypothetical protein
MIVEYRGNPPFYSYNLDGTVLKINGNLYDLETLRSDEEKIIDIYDEDKNYVANIIIPPNEYELLEINEQDEFGNPVFEKVLKPININKVKLTIWGKIENKKIEKEV